MGQLPDCCDVMILCFRDRAETGLNFSEGGAFCYVPKCRDTVVHDGVCLFRQRIGLHTSVYQVNGLSRLDKALEKCLLEKDLLKSS